MSLTAKESNEPALRTASYEWLPGIKAEKTRGNILESYAEVLDFELDLKNNKYKLLTGSAEEKPAEKNGDEKIQHGRILLVFVQSVYHKLPGKMWMKCNIYGNCCI